MKKHTIRQTISHPPETILPWVIAYWNRQLRWEPESSIKIATPWHTQASGFAKAKNPRSESEVTAFWSLKSCAMTTPMTEKAIEVLRYPRKVLSSAKWSRHLSWGTLDSETHQLCYQHVFSSYRIPVRNVSRYRKRTGLICALTKILRCFVESTYL